MDYEKTYNDFYSKHYNDIEKNIKSIFVECESNGFLIAKAYDKSLAHIGIENKGGRVTQFSNENIKKLFELFEKQFYSYSRDNLKYTITNDIKPEFDKIQTLELPSNYSLVNLIEDIAVIKVKNEISRLFQQNDKLTVLIYKYAEFDKFEMRDIGFMRMEIYPLFIYFNKKDDLKYYENLQLLIAKNEETKPSVFSVLEWASIFYYVETLKLNYDKKQISNRMDIFMEAYNIKSSKSNFKNSYYEAKNRINKNSNYSIDKLKSIIPFMKVNYIKAVAQIEKDIEYLEIEKNIYSDY